MRINWQARLASWRRAAAQPLHLLSGASLDRRLGPHLAQLPAHEQALNALAADAENTFVAIGTALQEQADLSGQLVAQGDRLVALTVSASDDDPVRAAVQLIQQTLAFIDLCGHQTRELGARLDRYHEQSGQLLKEEQQVERILAPLRVIQRLFRIESVVLPPEMQAGFEALSSEIPKFESDVRETFVRHAAVLATTRERIAATAARLRERLAEQDRTAESERSRIEQSLAALEQESARGRERNERLAAIIREVDCATRGLVVSLQYQDITRQKIDHVVVALREIGVRVGSTRRVRVRHHAAYLHQTCRIEALQAKTVAQELDQALAGIATGTDVIRSHLERVETECWPRAEFKAVAAAVQQRMAGLQAVVREVSELVPLSLATAEEAMRVLDCFGDVAANVATTAREMAESMRLIALNAQVLAAQAGEKGAGLLVLAERTYAISDEIKRTTDRISHEFTGAAAQLNAVTEQCEALKQHAIKCRRDLESRRQPVEQGLGRYRDETVKILGTLDGLLERTSGHTDGMLQAARSDHGYRDTLERLHARLTTIAEACADAAAAQMRAGPAGETLGRIEGRYTMESERRVHAAALGGANLVAMPELSAPPCAFVAAEAGEAEPAAANLGENVELF